MKNNTKKLAYSRKIVAKANLKRFNMFAFTLIAFFAILALAMHFSGDITTIVSGKLFASDITMAGLVITANVLGNPDGQYTQGKQIKNILYFVEADAVDDSYTFPQTNSREIGNIVLKPGRYWKKAEVILDTPEISWKGASTDLSAEITNTGKWTLGGMDDSTLDFLEKGLKKGFYVVYDICANGNRWTTGNACKPSILTEFDGGSDKDKTATTVTFTTQCGKMWCKYTGTTPTLAAATVSADAVTIALTSNPQYQLTTGGSAAANITGFTGTADSDVGRTVTLLGSGGAHPSTIDTGDSFIVESTWTASVGAQITFKIYKDTSTYKFVEQSRT